MILKRRYRLYARQKVSGPAQQVVSAKGEEGSDEETEEQEAPPHECRIIEYGGAQVHLTNSQIVQARGMGVPGERMGRQLIFRAQIGGVPAPVGLPCHLPLLAKLSSLPERSGMDCLWPS